jgi:hypothetical protein
MKRHINAELNLTEKALADLQDLMQNDQFRSYLAYLLTQVTMNEKVLPPSDNPRRDAFAEGYRAVGLLIEEQARRANEGMYLKLVKEMHYAKHS